MKLIKNTFDGWVHYYLKNSNGDTIGTTKHPFQPETILMAKGRGIELVKLSHENCESIERGYDLEELINETFDNMGYHSTVTPHEENQFKLGYKLGFQKALELVGGHGFTKLDIVKAFRAGGSHTLGSHKDFKQTHPNEKEYIQSLQQTEWDVDIVTELVGECMGNNDDGCFMDSPGHNCGCLQQKQKLDKNGCVVLTKRDKKLNINHGNN